MTKTVFSLKILLTALGGSVSTLAFAPTHFWWILPLGLGVVFHLVASCQRVKHAFFYGGIFGFAYFLAGLWWVYKAFSGHIGFHPSIAFGLTALFCAFLALIPATTCSIAYCFKSYHARLFALAALWSLAEWLRSWLLTGFPWLLHGYSQIPDYIFSGWAPIIGVVGIGLVLHCFIACCLALVKLSNSHRIKITVGMAFLLLAPAGVNNFWAWTYSSGEMSAALVQGNVKQDLKWDEARTIQALRDYLDMVNSVDDPIIVLPETAFPLYFDDLPLNYIKGMRQAAGKNNGTVIAGAFIQDEQDNSYNSALIIEEYKINYYHKTHLVPYGEFFPVPDFLRELLKANGLPFSDLSPGRHKMPVALPNGFFAGLSICYEIAFGDELREQLPMANVLINITNDGWFDDSIMPMQHLQIAQARALESGRWVLRSANTGITAIIDDKGQIVKALPRQILGILKGNIKLRAGVTPYILLGDIASVVVCVFILLGLIMVLLRNKYRPKQTA